MKLRIKPYLRILIKENLVYFLFNILLFVLAFSFLIYNLDEIPRKQAKIIQLEQEVKFLKNQATLLQSRAGATDKTLDDYSVLLNNLIPNAEDFFSIIYSFEQLSQETGFIITAYNVDLKNTSGNKTKLKITGAGNKDAFIKFLEDYNFGGGRYITSDKIALSNDQSDLISLNVTLYHKNIATDSNISLANVSPKMIEEIKKISDKITYMVKDIILTEDSSIVDYPKKTNPF